MNLGRGILGEIDGMATLTFCGGDPVNCVDPTGLKVLSWLFGYGYSGSTADAFEGSFWSELSDQYWSGKMGQRATAAFIAETKIAIGVGEAIVGAKATVASGGIAAAGGYALVLDGASRTAGGLTDYASIFMDEPLANGDVIEEGFKMALGDRLGANARDVTSAILTAGTSSLLIAEREAAAAMEAANIAKTSPSLPKPLDPATKPVVKSSTSSAGAGGAFLGKTVFSGLVRPGLNPSTKALIRASARRNALGQFLDDAGQVIMVPTFGHRAGYECRRIIAAAEQLHLTQSQMRKYVNARPQFFKIEEKARNLSHIDELPGIDKLDDILLDMKDFFGL